MKYSILIPSYDPKLKNNDMFVELMRSINENSAGKDYEIIVRKNGASYVESHNDALRSCRGDHIIILNDDVLIKDPLWLEKLTDSDKIVSWKEAVFGARDNDPTWDFACWSMPRHIFEKIGYFDEVFKDGVGFEDNDYVYRAIALKIKYKIVPIDLIHYGGKVLHEMFPGDSLRQKNHVIFNIKWPNRLFWYKQ